MVEPKALKAMDHVAKLIVERDMWRQKAQTHKKSLDMLYGERFSDRAYHALKSRAERAETERDNLRGMFESITDELWLDLKDIDWCDWQDEAQERGLIVTVTTTDEEFINEWDSDQMLVYAWSDAARAAESEGD